MEARKTLLPTLIFIMLCIMGPWNGYVSATNSLDFDGVDDYVVTTVGNNVAGAFTAETWVKVGDTNFVRPIFSTRVGALTEGWELQVLANEQVEFRLATGAGFRTISSGSAIDTSWHHIAAVYDGDSSMYLYIDGALVSSRFDANGSIRNAANPLYIGGQPAATNYFLGQMDEVRIWERDRCIEEISDQLGCELDTSLVVLNSYYTFNQGVADSINTGLDSLIDLSGNGFDGTLNNFSLTGDTSNWTAGTSGIAGVCGVTAYPQLFVVSEGDTVFNGDSVATVADSTNFGGIPIGQLFKVTYELHNPGTDTLFVTSVSYSGGFAGDFNAIYTDTIPPAGTGLLEVLINPTVPDSISATVSIFSSDCYGASPYTFFIEGTVQDRAGALHFDGVDDYVQIPYLAANDFTTSWTLEGWFKPETISSGFQALIAKDPFPNPPSLWFDDDKIEVWMGNGTAEITSVHTLVLGEWVHVAATCDGNIVRLYVNGSLDSQATFAGTLATSATSYFLGYGEGGFEYEGEMDEIRLWDRPRNATEIAATMNCELDGDECNLVHYYNFNNPAAFAGGNNVAQTTLGDSAFNGGNGTLTNFTLLADTSNWTLQLDSVDTNCSSTVGAIPPIVLAFDTVIINFSGFTDTVLASDADSASCDYYSGIDSMWVSPAIVDCSNDLDSLYLVIQDSSGLIDSSGFVVSINDIAPPVIAVNDTTIWLDATGSFTIDTGFINSGTVDNCGVDSLWLSRTTFGCADLTAIQTITFYARDVNGNIDSTTANVTVLDSIFPVGSAVNTTTWLSAFGVATIDTTDVNGGVYDVCTIDSMWLSQSIFTCPDTNAPVSIWFYFRDAGGNIDSASALVTVIDTVPPTAVAANQTVSLDSFGSVTIDTTLLNAGSFDNCAIDTSWLSVYTFSCADTLAPNNVTYYAKDYSGNVDSTVVQVTVQDIQPPVVVGEDVVIILDAFGNATIDTSDVFVSASDNCDVDSVWLSQTTFDCSDVYPGSSDLTLTGDSTTTNLVGPASNGIGTGGNFTFNQYNIFEVYSTMTLDSVTVYPNGTGNIVVELRDNASGNLLQSTTVAVSPSSANAPVRIPIGFTITPGQYRLARGAASTEGGSYRNDAGAVFPYTIPGVVSITGTSAPPGYFYFYYNWSVTHFVAPTPVVYLYSSDISGNIDSVPVVVSVLDTVSPIVSANNTTIYLDSFGNFTIDTTFVNAGAYDLCGVDTMWLSQYDFNCGDTLAPVSIWLYAQDLGGLYDSASALVTVIDSTPPFLFYTDTTITLDSATGTFTIDTGYVNTGTWDNCSLDSIWLSQYTFTCSDTGLVQQIMFYAKDESGNVDSAIVNITVLDSDPPVFVTNDTTIWLDAAGQWTIDTGYVYSGSVDNCTFDTVWLERYVFTCADLAAPQFINVYARDLSGNVDSQLVQVTVLDSIFPVISVDSITIYLDGTGNYVVDTSEVNAGVYDICLIDSMWLSNNTYSCVDTGTIDTVWFYARDFGGNVDSAITLITILDSLPAVILSTDTTVYLDVTGNFVIDVTWIDIGTSDNCGIDSTWISDSTFTCADTSAPVSVWFYVKDQSGNVDSIEHFVTVIDSTRPDVVATDTTIWLDATGQWTIDTSYVHVSSYDNCQLDSFWLSRYQYFCVDSLTQPDTLFVSDISGNIDTVPFLITVLDTFRPFLSTTDTTIYLDNTGSFTIDTTWINVSTYDNCMVDTMFLSRYTFSCADTAAPQAVTFTAKDVSGNVDSIVRFVTVIDTTRPFLNTTDVTIWLDDSGQFTIDTTFINVSTYDNCEVDTMFLSQYDFNCADTAAPNPVTFTAIDVSGNIDSVTRFVTVIDSTRPDVVATDTTIWLDATGQWTIDTSYVHVSSYDNCQLDSFWLSRYTYFCADSLTQPDTLFVSDISGNIDTVPFLITVLDTFRPFLSTTDTTIYLDNTGSFTIDTTWINVSTYDNCTVDTMFLSRYTFSCADTAAPQAVTFTAKDVSGNVDSIVRFVTVIDTTRPFLNTTDVTIWLDDSGQFTIDTTFINVSTYDNCEVDTMFLSQYDFNCADTAAPNPVTFTAIDVSGNIDSVTRFVTVIDSTRPDVVATDTVIYLDTTGQWTIDTSYVHVSSYDNCQLDSFWLSRYTYFCADTQPIQDDTLFVSDISGNIDTVPFQITVFDTLIPVLSTTDTTIWLDSFGNFTIDTTFINVASWDNCEIDTMWLSQYDFNCADTAAPNPVTFVAKDISGNIDSITRFVTVIDSTRPVLVTTDTTIWLDSTGNFTIDTTWINLGSWDNCEIDTMWLSRYDFSCIDTAAGQAVTFFALDVSGNLNQITHTVTVIDSIKPALVTTDTTIWLDSTGNFTIDTTFINVASWDNCEIDTMWLSQYDFVCADTAAANPVTFYAKDVSGNVDSITRLVTVIDSIKPVLATTDTTIWLDSFGNFTIDTTFINVASWDNCEIDTMWLSQYDFNCADTAAPNPVTFVAKDISGNIDSITRFVTVIDSTRPVLVTTDTTIWLDSTGNFTIDTTWINLGSWDNCEIDTMWLSRYDFSCIDTAAGQAVTFFALDVSGNLNQITHTVTVIDSIKPALVTTDTTIWLDSTGNFTIDTTFINVASWDNCEIDTMWLSQYDFVCADTAAANLVTFYAKDVSGNVDSITRLVTVIDSIKPVLATTDTTIWLDSFGNFTIDTTFINVASWDNCEIDTMWLSQYDFNCADTAAPNPVTFVAKDISGNIDSITRFVTVIDSTRPVLVTTDTTIWLDTTGSFTIDTTWINSGSWDNCEIDTMFLSQYTFTCADTNAANPVLFTAIDVSGNINTITRFVTVIDSTRPDVVATDTAIYLDATGQITIDTSFVLVSAYDNCQLDSFWLSRYTYTCGDTNIFHDDTLFVSDISGNIDTVPYVITVFDTTRPFLTTTDTTIYLDSTGNFTIDTTWINVSTYDNCEVDTMFLSQYDFNCADTASPNPVLFTAIDISGNVDTVTRFVTVEDTTRPVLVLTDTVVYLDSSGFFVIDTTWINVASWDNCEIDTMFLSQDTFACADTSAAVPVLFTAIDVSGNTISETRFVTVFDTISPFLVTTDTAIFLDSTGNFTIDSAWIDVATTDNCQLVTLTLSQYDFDCADTVAPFPVLITATDLSGNTDTITRMITVRDTTRPFLFLTDTTVYLDSSGVYIIDPSYIDTGSYDNCSIDSTWLSDTAFTCGDTVLGNPVTFFAKDVSGNLASETRFVFVIDTLRPVLVTEDDTVFLDATGNITIDTTNLNVASWDNCEIDTMWLSRYDFNCSDTVVANPVTFYARDVSGNVDSVVQNVYVFDTLVPVLATTDTTIWLDSTGNFTIDTTWINVSSSDNCEIDTMFLSRYDFSCIDTAAPQAVLFTAIDVSGNVDTITRFVTVIDSTKPFLATTDTTIYLDSTGVFTIDTTFINTATYDNCAIDTMWLSQYDFSCGDTIVGQPVIFYAQDISGNVDSVTRFVTVFDTLFPVLVTTDTTIYLDPTGNFTIDTTFINVASWDNCQIDTMWLSRYDFTCADTSAGQLVTFYARDVSGNVDSVDHIVTVVDTLVPVLVTTDTTVWLDATGSFTIDTTYINVASYDNCEIDTMWLSNDLFTCGDTVAPQSVIFYAEDISGNVDSVERFVTVLDTTRPFLTVTDTTIYLNNAGSFTIDTTFINVSSYDNCAIDTMWLSQYTFGCGDTTSAVPVTFFAQDVSGNVASQTVNVTVIDSTSPIPYGQNITVYLDSFGVTFILGSDLDSASYDNCAIDTFISSIDTFFCSDIGAPVPVTFTVRDVSGNQHDTTLQVTVLDTIAPRVITQDITVYLDPNGADTITSFDIDNGSWDSCMIQSYVLNDSIFDCSNTGANTVVLTVTDIHGNSSFDSAIVTVIDSTHPTVLVMTDTIFVDSNNVGIITPDSIDAGSFDNCGGFTRAVSVTTVGCAEMGETIPVDLIVTDASGNISIATTTVVVWDTIAPLPTSQDINVYIDTTGFITIDTGNVITAISDTCELDSAWLSVDTFFCSDVGSTITLVTFLRDSIGNIGTDTSLVTVFDTTAPFTFLNDTVIYLADSTSGNGYISIDSASLDSASWDNCTIASIVHDTAFTCADVGLNVVTVTITDIFGNVTTTSANVTVVDTVPPHAISDTIIRYVDASGSANVELDSIDFGSFDNCGIASRVNTPTVVTCADVNDTVQVTLTITDVNGNVDSTYGYVLVYDTIRPTILIQDITVYLDSTGNVGVTPADVDTGTFDNCTIDSLWLSDTAFNCGDIGINGITFYAVDIFGNIDSQGVNINVLDTVPPTLEVQNDTVWLDATGTAYTSVDSILITTNNACGVDTVFLSDSVFTCIDTGINNITITSVDVNGNTTVIPVTVLVIDSITPTILVQDDTLYLDASGVATLDSSMFELGTFDNCGIASYAISETNFDCDSAGLILDIGITVTDVNSNVSVDTIQVTVLDTVLPQVHVQNITVYLDSFGSVTINAGMIDSASSDACGFASLSLNDSVFSCADVGPNTVVFTAVDVNGNADSATAVVTVVDTIAPDVVVTNDTIALNASGVASITLDSIRVSSFDACGVASEFLDSTNFDCSELGLNTVTLTVTDSNSNVTILTATVYVIDTIPPTILLADDSLFLDASGVATLDSSLFDLGTFDNCGIASYVISETNFDCDSAGLTLPIGITVTDVFGTVATDTVNITIVDTVLPNVVTQDITVQLDTFGNVTIDSSMIDDGSTDACGIVTLVLSDTAFDCTNVGTNTVTLYATDVNGNVDSATAVVTVEDNIAPLVVVTNDTIALDASGTASITLDSIRVSSFDACGVATEVLDSTNFDCSELGLNTVTLTVTDNNGNATVLTATVLVIDTIAPTILAQDDTLYLGVGGTATLDSSLFELGSFDNCSITSYVISETDFDCDSAGLTLTIGLTVTDQSGNTSIDSIDITVLDTVLPNVVTQDITVQLDTFGNVTIDSSMIDDGSTDACGIVTLVLSDTAFDCTNVGTNTVTLYATDVNGNVDSATAVVTVEDNIAPLVVVTNDTIALDASGTASITLDSIRVSSFDACGVATEVLDSTNFDCSELGLNTVTLTVTDNNGNATVLTATVLVIDTTAPTILAQDDTLYLGVGGTATLDSSLFELGSFDNCSITSYVISETDFDCDSAGLTLTIGLTVTDQSGNTSIDSIDITVLDTVLPNVVTQDITVQLDTFGNVTIDSSMIDDGSTDACGIVTLVLSDTAFDCTNVGTNTVTLYATDVNGNVDSATAVVTVEDNIAPLVVVTNDTIALDASGTASITLDSIRVSSFDACGVATEVLDSTNFDCSKLGLNTVTLTVTDNNGNATVLTATVLVIDTIAPTIQVADDTLYLDVTGNGVLDTSLFDIGSFDNCGIASYVLSETNFDCDSVGFTLPIGLTVTDASGNVSIDTVNITIGDTIDPNVSVQNITVYLDSFGDVTIDATMIDNGTTDGCGLSSISLDDSIFNCADVGPNTVLFTAVDIFGNTASANATVTVVDSIAPDVVITNDTIALDASGTASITLDSIRISSFDACGVASETLDSTNFDCSEVGLNTVTLTVTDSNGNATVLTATVLVIDTIAPTILVQDDTLYLNASGVATLDTSLFDLGSFDNCGIASYVLSETAFDCDSAGQTVTINLTVTDVNSNVSTDSIQLTILDTVTPNMAVTSIIVQLDSFGNVTIDSSMIDAGTSDACGIATLVLSDTAFDCADVGANTVTLVATDVNGNIDSATATVTVQDNIAPDVVITNDTIALDASGTASITLDSIRISSFDACGVASETLDSTNFDCSEVGLNTVTLTVTDSNSNTTVLTATVLVIDTIAPTILVQDDTLYLNASGVATLDTSLFDLGSFDNCGIASYVLSETAFDCDSAGQTVTINLTVTDVNSNVSTDSIQLTILDTVRPSMAVTNITVNLDSFGSVTIDSSMIDVGTSDACGIATLVLSDTAFDCSDVGTNTVTLVATDVNGNIDSATAVVTVEDNIAPDVVITNDTVALDANGTANITLDSIRISSFDACGVASELLDSTNFDCSEVGLNTVTLTVTDSNSNTTVLTATVLVIDTIAPTILAQNETLYLDASGLATLDTSLFDLGSFDNCGIASYVLSETAFDCDSAGQTVTIDLTVTDVNGNISTDNIQITVLDTVTPNMSVTNITVELDSFGNVTIDSSMIDAGTSDACGIATLVLSDTAFSCSDVGTNTVTLVATDVNGNIDSATAVVTVEDNIAPSAFAVTSLDVFLDSLGGATIGLSDIDSFSSDACGIDTMYLSDTIFDCSDVGAPITVTLTVTDVNNNTSTAQTIVTVIDDWAPIISVQDDTVYLGADGTISITPANINNGTWDSCGIASLVIDTSDFTCANTSAPVSVTLTATDVNGNDTTATALVYVIDSIRPVIVCQGDITVSNDSGACGAIVNYTVPTATDTCGINSVVQTDASMIPTGGFFPVGTTLVQYVATDVNGNMDTCSFSVTVLDTAAPVISCQADTTICDSIYTFGMPPAFDNCSIDTVFQIAGIQSGQFYPVGTTVNTFVAIDASGNSDTCSYSVTRDDYPSAAVAGLDTALCNETEYQLAATAPVIGIGSWSVLTTGAIVPDTFNANALAQQLVIGENIFTWTVGNGVCPVNIDTITVRVDDLPTEAQLPGTIGLCEAFEVTLTGNDPAIGVGQWNVISGGDLADSSSNTVIVDNLIIGDIYVEWAVTNGVCEVSRDTQIVENLENPTVELGEDVFGFAGYSVQLNPIVTGADVYSWTPANIFNDPTAERPVATVVESTLITLTVTSDSGCTASDEMSIVVTGLSDIPTGITPNGDGINDVWNIDGLENYPNVRIHIWDSYGREIFFSEGYEQPWDGTFNGVLLPRATYYWIIDLQDDYNEPLNGIISIIR